MNTCNTLCGRPAVTFFFADALLCRPQPKYVVDPSYKGNYGYGYDGYVVKNPGNGNVGQCPSPCATCPTCPTCPIGTTFCELTRECIVSFSNAMQSRTPAPRAAQTVFVTCKFSEPWHRCWVVQEQQPAGSSCSPLELRLMLLLVTPSKGFQP